MTESSIISLIHKYLKNSISDSELKTLEKLLEKDKNSELFKKLAKEDYLVKTENREFDAQNAFEKSKIALEKIEKKKVFRLQPLFKYAAVLVFLLGTAIYFASLQPSETNTVLSDKVTDKQIQLQFEDGTQQLLSGHDADSVRGIGNMLLGFVNNGTLSYTNKNNKKLAYNTLKIPHGKRFQVALSDGTTVHLNSGSSLRYPVTFLHGRDREVFLEGEAFFEVAKDTSHRFVVNANNLDVEVLGTEFNVSAYKEDTTVETTLREGSVKVNDDGNSIFLSPSEQSSWDKTTGGLSKKVVNVKQFTSWLDGELVFRSTPFKEILKKLERHYDVIILNNDIVLAEEKFTARFDQENIGQVLLYFSKSYGFEFESNDRTITIK